MLRSHFLSHLISVLGLLYENIEDPSGVSYPCTRVDASLCVLITPVKGLYRGYHNYYGGWRKGSNYGFGNEAASFFVVKGRPKN